MTAGQPLVEVGVFPPVQLVDGQLPDGERPRGAVASVAVTLVRHPTGEENKKDQRAGIITLPGIRLGDNDGILGSSRRKHPKSFSF